MDDLDKPDPRRYDEAVSHAIPHYSILHPEIADLVYASGIDARTWLDTGCGTGAMTLAAKEYYPDTRFVMSDPDTEMLAYAAEKIGQGNNYIYIDKATHTLDLPDGSVDIITAVMSHHYYSRFGREAATANCYRMLSENGLYVTLEHCLPPDEEGVNIALERWRMYMLNNGLPHDLARAMVARYKTVIFPITIESQLALLKKCGFEKVGVFWRSYTVTGFYAYKHRT